MVLFIVLSAFVIVYVPTIVIIKLVLIPSYDKVMAKVNAHLERVTPTPACAIKQQEVYDFYMNILKTNHNTRGEYWFHVQAENHCSLNEARMIMLQHDCDDAGIEMNFEYAASLTGYAF